MSQATSDSANPSLSHDCGRPLAHLSDRLSAASGGVPTSTWRLPHSSSSPHPGWSPALCPGHACRSDTQIRRSRD